MKTLVRLATALAVLAAAPQALANGPLANCSSGQPYLWAAGGSAIPFNPDQGPLGPLGPLEAVSAVADAFAEWQLVPTSTAAYVQGPLLPVDVDITNFGPYLDAFAPDGLSAIVFDNTGEIFDLLFGPGSGILGFAGPEWGDPATCTITEGLSFLNGPSFDDLVAAKDVMVHEFGHYTNLAHTAVNGQIFLASDTSGPTPFDTFGTPGTIEVIETMYPFYFGPGSGTQTLQADDVAGVSTLYPEPGFAAVTGAIEGTIYGIDGVTRLSGVNVIARNVADPFVDAVSAVSGDRTDSSSQADPLAGTYRLNGLTPGAQYAVYVDQILAGGFSTPPILLPNAEEFSNGAAESNNITSPDDPSTFAPIAVAAGAVSGGVNVVFNGYRPGDPLPVGDESSVQLALPFPFVLCGQSFDSLYVNANGFVSFGGQVSDFSESAQEFLGGRPRIAGLWDDLDATDEGVVTYASSSRAFTVSWTGVPEWLAGGSNTFSITLERDGDVELRWGDLSATDGLVGVSCGGLATSGFENETRFRKGGRRCSHSMEARQAAYEIFTSADNALDGYATEIEGIEKTRRDSFRGNDTVATAARIPVPFSSGAGLYTALDPAGGDVDFYRFRAKAGDILALEIVRGAFDSVLGVFDATTGELLVADDDGGSGLRSRLLLQAFEDLDLAIAVGAFPDLDFTGVGEGGGRYVLEVRTYRGELVAAGDDTSSTVALPFTFPFAGGAWTEAQVNSNGNLTFGAGSDDFGESVADLVGGPPRLAPLWDDLDASTGLVIAESSPLTAKINWVSVPEFFSDSPNYFSATLVRGGTMVMDWGATARNDALVGRSVGGGAADPGETNLSAYPLPLFGGPTVYEQFVAPDPFDMNYRAILVAKQP